MLNVVKQALKEAIGPGFTYEYVFACESVAWKRRWIDGVMELMLDPDTPGGPGSRPCCKLKLPEGGPCCFGDILKLPDGSCRCFRHKKNALSAEWMF